MNLTKFLSKYKKFLLLFLLFFTLNVKADVNDITPQYSDSVTNNYNSTLIENVSEYINNSNTVSICFSSSCSSRTKPSAPYLYYIDTTYIQDNLVIVGIRGGLTTNLRFFAGGTNLNYPGSISAGQSENNYTTILYVENNEVLRFAQWNDYTQEIKNNINSNKYGYRTWNYPIYNDSTGNQMQFAYYLNYDGNIENINFIYNNYYNTSQKMCFNGTCYVNDNNVPLQSFMEYLNSQFNMIPEILQPEINYFNGYSTIKFLASHYTPETIQDYNIIIENVTNGTIEYIQPVLDPSEQSELTINVYESTTFHYYLLDLNTDEILEEYYTSVNINYSEEQNFYININNIDNENKTINYSYIKNENNTINNYRCYHKIYNQSEVEDLNCNLNDNSFTLNVGSNTSVSFFIYDSNNNLIYTNQQNFIFNLGNTYITFDENYINNFVNLNVIIHKYNQNQIVKYSIDNSSEFEAILYNMNTYDNSYFFNINNLNRNQIVRINVYENNTIIASAEYKINIYRNIDAWQTSNDLKSFFNSLNINNISSELKNLIKQFGELIINSRLGNLILLQFFITSITLILKLIRK